MRALLICKKTKPYLFNQNVYEFYESKYITSNLKCHKDYDYLLNGKIVVECDFEIEEIKGYGLDDYYATNGNWQIIENSLGDDDINKYLKGKNGYAIHIKNLHIFDKPRELSECHYLTLEKGFLRQIKKSPSNMCYALTTRYDKDILILVSPQEMCRIANGEQTTLVRKKVLKEMLK